MFVLLFVLGYVCSALQHIVRSGLPICQNRFELLISSKDTLQAVSIEVTCYLSSRHFSCKEKWPSTIVLIGSEAKVLDAAADDSIDWLQSQSTRCCSQRSRRKLDRVRQLYTSPSPLSQAGSESESIRCSVLQCSHPLGPISSPRSCALRISQAFLSHASNKTIVCDRNAVCDRSAGGANVPTPIHHNGMPRPHLIATQQAVFLPALSIESALANRYKLDYVVQYAWMLRNFRRSWMLEIVLFPSWKKSGCSPDTSPSPVIGNWLEMPSCLLPTLSTPLLHGASDTRCLFQSP